MHLNKQMFRCLVSFERTDVLRGHFIIFFCVGDCVGDLTCKALIEAITEPTFLRTKAQD